MALATHKRHRAVVTILGIETEIAQKLGGPKRNGATAKKQPCVARRAQTGQTSEEGVDAQHVPTNVPVAETATNVERRRKVSHGEHGDQQPSCKVRVVFVVDLTDAPAALRKGLLAAPLNLDVQGSKSVEHGDDPGPNQSQQKDGRPNLNRLDYPAPGLPHSQQIIFAIFLTDKSQQANHEADHQTVRTNNNARVLHAQNNHTHQHGQRTNRPPRVNRNEPFL
eukprot:Lithocolla_globosa_v1_NODE_616_length_3597_cov_5.945229.p3 type:complete len:223 gc:universal NODE_616_length_3597_cov_5.945229:3182-2514(-)